VPSIPTFVKIPPDAPEGFINLQLQNTGQLDVIDARIVMVGHLSDVDLPIDALSKELNVVARKVDELENAMSRNGLYAQIRPNSAAVITLEDVPLDLWLKPQQNGPPRNFVIKVTENQWTKFERGDLAIYVLYAARYEDEGHPGAYWSTQNCLYFRGAVTFQHNCAENKIELNEGKRWR